MRFRFTTLKKTKKRPNLVHSLRVQSSLVMPDLIRHPDRGTFEKILDSGFRRNDAVSFLE